MADSALQPSELFKKVKVVDIPQLVRKPADRFISMPAAQYEAIVKKAVSSSGISAAFKHYLTAMVENVVGAGKPEQLNNLLKTGGKDIDLNQVKSYFGEVLGPLHLLRKGDYDEVVFPVRSNYELFDYFMGKKGQYTGFSAKVAGGTSNTLAPALINERVENMVRKGKVPPQAKVAAEVMMKLGKMAMFAGIASSVGTIIKANMLPPDMPKSVVAALKKINFTGDCQILESNKLGLLTVLPVSNKAAYKVFMDDYILPRLRLPEADKEKYRNGKKAYTATNIVYGLGMLLVDSNKADKFDVSPLIQTTFQDLNVLKMGVDSSGKPSFELKNVSKSHEKYYFRSKHRWDVVKDKLGVQL